MSVGGLGCCWTAEALEANGELVGLEKKLGLGKAEGAGEAWKVAPAKAGTLDAPLIEADAAR